MVRVKGHRRKGKWVAPYNRRKAVKGRRRKLKKKTKRGRKLDRKLKSQEPHEVRYRKQKRKTTRRKTTRRRKTKRRRRR